jgi:YVTN family beta-propeller protein
VAVNPAGTRAYVTNTNSFDVSVIDTSTHTVVATIPVGGVPLYVAFR